MLQATTADGSAAEHEPGQESQLVDALYEIAVSTRRLSGRDPVDTADVRLLWHLAETGACRASDLADSAGLDLSTVSRHVRDLEDAGYVVRTPDPRDRRAVTLQLSAEGSVLLAEARASRALALTPILESWRPADRATLTRLLTALARDLTTATDRRGCPDGPTPRPTDSEDTA